MKRKKIINIIIVAFISILLVCTYFSETIKNMLLPKVTVVNLKSGAIGDAFETQGIINYENTHKIYASSDWNIEEISAKVNQNVKKGDSLGKVDNNAITLEERQEEIQIMKLEDELKTLRNTPNADKNKIKEDEYELSTEKLKYQQIRKGLDENGNIISDIDGNIVSINSQGSSASANSAALFEIADSNTKFSVSFEIDSNDSEKFSIGQNINILINTDEKDNKQKQVSATISQKNYNSEKDTYALSAEIGDTLDLKSGDKVTISSVEETKRYDNVVPKSCLSEYGGLDYIFVVKEKDGALDTEEYVQKVQVQVTASDDTNCAIKAFEGGSIPQNYGIVMSTSKSIEDNSEVKLDTEN
jgi:HlyD family secretion protein